jgi:TRAP-type mannitol/chloroaromatic compound transport system substrate-binding protein
MVLHRRIILVSLFIGAFFLSLGLGSAANAAEKAVTWKVQSVYRGEPAENDKRIIKDVEALTEGRLKFEVFQVGEIMNHADILDGVGKGLVATGTDFPSYWAGKDLAFDLLGTFPVSMSFLDFAMWYQNGGGKAFYQELYGKFGCVYFPYMLMGPESGFRTNKPIRTVEDFKGLKLRTAGYMTGKILQELGAAPTSVPFAEIYESLRRGVIDGCEVSTPYWDWTLGFQEIAKYVSKPSWHQPYAVCGLIVNKKLWGQLPADLQRLVEAGFVAKMYSESIDNIFRDAQTEKKFQQKGVTSTKLSDADLDKIEQIMIKIQAKVARENPLYAKILKSQTDFMKSFADYRTALSPYFTPRNPKSYAEPK